MTDRPPIPELQIQSIDPVGCGILNWSSVEVWGLNNHSLYNAVSRQSQQYNLSREDRMKLITHALLKHNEELMNRVNELEIRAPRTVILPSLQDIKLND